jgi:hypothetical protein
MNNDTPKVSEAEEGFSGNINHEQWHRAFRLFWKKRGINEYTFNGKINEYTFNGKYNNERDTTDTAENL